MLEVIGFCDAGYKPHGLDAVTFFKEEHRFRVQRFDDLPKFEEMKRYVTERGYVVGAPKFCVLRIKQKDGQVALRQGGRISTRSTQCDPVYKYA